MLIFNTEFVNQKIVNQRLRRLESSIKKDSQATPEQIGKLTRDYIIRFMPSRSGDSRRSIGYVLVSKGNNQTSVEVRIEGQPHPRKRWNDKWFNLPWYMFEGPRAESQIWRSGNIPAMRAVIPYMEERFRKEITNKVQKRMKLKE